MAKAEKVQVVQVKGIKLELSVEEAQALQDVLGLVGGSPSTTRRRFIDPIYSALDAVGFVSRGCQDGYDFDDDDRDGRITFK